MLLQFPFNLELDFRASHGVFGPALPFADQRLPQGVVLRNNEVNDDKLGFIASGELSPAKSRVLLQLALTKTKDVGVIQKMFYTY